MNGSTLPLRLPIERSNAEALYNHLGTMPWAPGSWSNQLRSDLSELLATGCVSRAVDEFDRMVVQEANSPGAVGAARGATQEV